MIVTVKAPANVEVSDGFHTFTELYEHRCLLWIAVCRLAPAGSCWRSNFHSDGTAFPGWFLLGLHSSPGRQMTYHLPIAEWQLCDFATTLHRAPEFDGHTPDDVAWRVRCLIRAGQIEP